MHRLRGPQRRGSGYRDLIAEQGAAPWAVAACGDAARRLSSQTAEMSEFGVATLVHTDNTASELVRRKVRDADVRSGRSATFMNFLRTDIVILHGAESRARGWTPPCASSSVRRWRILFTG